MEPLSKLISVIPDARRISIQRLINDSIKRGEVRGTRDAALTLQELTNTVSRSRSDSVFQVRRAIEGARISSEDWNRTQNEVFIDLHALYEEIKNVNELSARHSEINRSDLRKSKSAIVKVINDIRLYQFLKEFPDYQDVKFVDFSDARNLATRRPLANSDPRVRKLELAPRFRDRLQRQNLDLRTTEVVTRTLGGGTPGGFDESFTPELMLDDDPDTFWAELVMTDGRVKHTYTPSGDSGLGSSFVSNGIIAEVEIILSNTQIVNNINLLAFGAYPVRLVDLAYKETPHATTWITVPSFSVTDSSLDWYEFSFNPINVAVLRVSLEQVNYTTNIFHLPENLVHNQALWSQIINDKVDRTIHQIEITEVEAGKIAAQPEQLAYLNAISEVDEEVRLLSFSDQKASDHYKIVENLVRGAGRILTKIEPASINDALVPLGAQKEGDADTPNIVEVRKNEFIVGVRTIELSNILYQPISFYESPKFVSGATILETSITTNEEHPVFNDGISKFNRTSVEYEIEIGENTSFPIVPVSNDPIPAPGGAFGYQVPDEYIPVLRTSQVGFTRFEPLSINVIVRKNGRRADFNDYVFTIDSATNKGRLEILNNFDANAIYTLSYVATHESAVVDINAMFDSTDLQEPDMFQATTRSNSIKLSYFPYIEYEIVNNTGRWLKDDEEDAKWHFNPTQQNYKAGTISVESGAFNVTGSSTDFTGNLDTSAGITNVFRVKGEDAIYSIESVSSATVLTLSTAYSGGFNTGVEYQVGQSFEVDGRTFALDNIIYEPVKVFVNDVKAFNLTNYRTLEHPAFVPGERAGRQYQYIHSGQLLYFNKPINGATIEVFYAWLTQYVQLKVILRCNIPVRTNITPKIDDFTIRIKNSKL